jgi:integrase
MRTTITQDTLKHLEPGQLHDIWDDKYRGLLLRVRPSGTTTWLVSLGRRGLLTLGGADELTPEKARALARAKRGDDSKFKLGLGPDPLVERRRKKAGSLRAFLDGPYREWAGTHHRDVEASIDRVERAFPSLLDKPLDKIDAFTIERWRAGRRKDGIKATTTNREIAALKGVLSRAIDCGALAGPNPLKPVKATHVDKFARVRFLSPAEEKALLDALTARETSMRAARTRFNAWRTDRGYKPVPDYPAGQYVDHVQPVVRLAMLTGARRGELLALRWADVDLVAKMVTFRGSTTKTGTSRRVPLNQTAVDILTKWKPKGAAGDRVVFPGDAGKPMQSLKTAFARVLKDAGIKGFRFHDLRHHAASRLVQAGTDLYIVAQILGHSSMTMTMRYAHLRDADKADALAKLG